MRAHVRFTILLLCLAVCGLFIACDIGLGFKVNTSVPKIQIPDSDPFSRDIQPGGFLNGSDNDIFIDITHEQGFLITDAFMSIDFTDIDGVKQTAIVNGEYDSVNDKWVFSIDTVALRIADGKIKTRITAVDSSGKKTTTTDIIYSVKNLHPQIEMTIPAIKGGNFDDETFMNDLRSKDPVFVGFDLMGLATDDAGIKLGWPKIMLWPVDDPAVPLDGFGFPAETNLKWGIWRSMVVAQAADGLTATRITWPMKQLENNPVPIKDAQDRLGNTVTDNYRVAEGDSVRLPNGYYRFIMWAKDVFGNDYFYPNRTGSAADWGTTPNIKWIEINHMVSEIPIAVIDEAPDYYNGIGDFTVKFTVNSKTPLASVKLFISDSSSGMGNNSPDYDVPLVTPADGIYSFAVSFSNGEPFNINKWPQAIGNGPLYINIKATDENIKTNPGTYRNFIYDVTPPAVKFERPFNIANPPVTLPVDLKGTFASTNTSYEIYRPSNNPSANPPAGPRWSTGVVTVGGWANDPSTGIPSSGIKEVWYYIGNLGDDAVGITHGQRENIYNNAKWINTNLGGIQPADGWSGNLYTWSYTENFNSFRTTRPGDIQEAAQFGFPDSNNTLDVTADLTGTYDRERFYLPFYVKVLDGSGNTMIIHYKLCIDPNMDIPQVSISYPNEDDLLGGEVRLSGTASDNDWVYTVLIRIQKDGDAGYYLPKNESFFYQIPGNSAFPGFDKDPNGWFEAKITGNIAQVVGWYYNINSDGGLDPKLGDSTVPVKIEVRAIDSKDGVAADSRSLVGPAEIRNIRFSAGVPTISLPQIVKDGVDARNYSDGIKTSGQIKFAFTVRDDEGFSLVRVRINGAPYDVVTNMNKPAAGLSGWIITGPFDDGKDPSRPSCFTIEVPIDTAQYAAVGRTGSLTVDVSVSDNSTPPSTTSASYNLDIDNYYPFTTIDVPYYISGQSFVLKGTAKDYDASSGPVQGLSRVLVYFEEAQIHYADSVSDDTRTIIGTGKYLNPRNKAVGDTDAVFSAARYNGSGITLPGSKIPPMVSYNNVKDGDTGLTVANFINFPAITAVTVGNGYVYESPHAMVIDNQEIGEGTDTDGDSTYGEVWPSTADKDWQVRMNTENFPSGPLVVHYIVMDQAGNATHYSRPAFIGNYKPVIASFNLGTDVNGNGTVEAGEYRPVPTTVGNTPDGNKVTQYNPPFRVRNYSLAINLVSQAGTGNNGRNYKVSYVAAGAPINASQMKEGEVYTISAVGSTNWLQLGVPVSLEDVASGITFVSAYTTSFLDPAIVGDGKVIPYTNVVSDIPYAVSVSGDKAVLTISGTSAFTGIPDSVSNTDSKLFIVKVYDNVVSQVWLDGVPQPASESEQLAHAFIVAMNIENTDASPPSINVSRFGKKWVQANNFWDRDDLKTEANAGNYNENIVMNGTTRMGYVQYAEDSGTGVADISGMVKFLGKAEDNQRIRRITVTIDGYNGGNPLIAADWPAGTDDLASMWTEAQETTGPAKGWYFNIVNPNNTLDYGNVINWEFAWDSSGRDNMVGASDLVFTVIDYSAGGNPRSDTISVNVAPYITDVVTGLSGAYSTAPSAFARSANGWYPVRENEVITVKGFNLGSGTTPANSITGVTINGTPLAINNAATVASGNFRIISKNEIQANVGTAAASGALEVRVGSTADASRTPSLNNLARSDKTAAYNMEPNGVNNNNLTNARKLYIWNTGYVLNQTNILRPFLRMDSAGARYLTFGYYPSNGKLYVIKNTTGLAATTGLAQDNDGATYGGVAFGTNRFTNNTLGIAPGGTEWAVVSSNITAGTSDFQMIYNNFGAGQSTTAGTNTNGKRLMMRLGNDPFRIEFPRVAVRRVSGSNASPANIAVSFQDSLPASAPLAVQYGQYNGSAWSNSSFTNATTVTAPASNSIVADNTSSDKANSGKYSALGLLSNGAPVIAWYDSIQQCLWFSYITGTDGSAFTKTQWQNNAVKIMDLAGTHVDLAVDENDNIHLAYVDVINGGLYYTFIPAVNGGTANAAPGSKPAGAANSNTIPNANVKTVRVDTFLTAGAKCMINVRSAVPYITYLHNAFSETRNSVRVAWLKNRTDLANPPQGTNLDQTFSGGWEVMTVPAETVPLMDQYVCNGVPSGTATLAAGPQPTSASYANSTLRSYSGLQNTIFVGYMTQSWYEGAVLKDNIQTKTNW